MSNFMRGMLSVLMALGAMACSTLPPSKPLYANILPPGYVLKKATAPVDMASLKSKKLVLIPSENFNAIAKFQAEYFEGGGLAETRAWQAPVLSALGDPNAARSDRLMVKAFDPRHFADEVVLALAPYFATIESAADLATARSMGADCYGVIDYYANETPGVDVLLRVSWRGQSHVSILDAGLAEFLAVQGDFTEPFPATLLGDVVADQAATYAKVMQQNIDQIKTGIRARLGAP